MGGVPSREVLCTAPFRTPHGGTRQIALIPFTKEFFPTSDCPLFQQLYEARMDPSVRYYVRTESSDMRQDIIPPVSHTREELFEMYRSSVARMPLFETNARMRDAVLRAGEGTLKDDVDIMPVPCAVVFLYEGVNHIPEGSIRLGGDHLGMYVKVIGGVGDASSVFSTAGLRKGVFHMAMFITKSAGDHNMGRVALLVAYTYYHQCVNLVGLPEPPVMPVVFLNVKTNIPFLCFVRELRDRTEGSLAAPERPTMWLEDDCLRGFIPRKYAQHMCKVFAKHFLEYVETKAEARAAKQLRRLGNSRQGKIGAGLLLPAAATAATTTTTAAEIDSGAEACSLTPQRGPDPSSPSTTTAEAAATSGGGGGASGKDGAQTVDAAKAKSKVTYVVRGYITAKEATLVADSAEANEVYVSCCESTVRVVRPIAGVDPATLTKGVSARPSKGCVPAGASSGKEGEHCARGGGDEEEEEKGMTAATTRDAVVDEEGQEHALEVVYTTRVHVGFILCYFNPVAGDKDITDDDDDDADDNATSAAAATGAEEEGARYVYEEDLTPRPGGCWRVNRHVFIENVLLSLVRDECRNAREADVDDPRWVRDEERNCPMHDGSFYIWRFRRGVEVFYYGTVPKFANPNRRRGDDGPGDAETAAVAGATGPGMRGTQRQQLQQGGGGGRVAGALTAGSKGDSLLRQRKPPLPPHLTQQQQQPPPFLNGAAPLPFPPVGVSSGWDSSSSSSTAMYAAAAAGQQHHHNHQHAAALLSPSRQGMSAAAVSPAWVGATGNGGATPLFHAVPAVSTTSQSGVSSTTTTTGHSMSLYSSSPQGQLFPQMLYHHAPNAQLLHHHHHNVPQHLMYAPSSTASTTAAAAAAAGASGSTASASFVYPLGHSPNVPFGMYPQSAGSPPSQQHQMPMQMMTQPTMGQQQPHGGNLVSLLPLHGENSSTERATVVGNSSSSNNNNNTSGEHGHVGGGGGGAGGSISSNTANGPSVMDPAALQRYLAAIQEINSNNNNSSGTIHVFGTGESETSKSPKTQQQPQQQQPQQQPSYGEAQYFILNGQVHMIQMPPQQQQQQQQQQTPPQSLLSATELSSMQRAPHGVGLLPNNTTTSTTAASTLHRGIIADSSGSGNNSWTANFGPAGPSPSSSSSPPQKHQQVISNTANTTTNPSDAEQQQQLQLYFQLQQQLMQLQAAAGTNSPSPTAAAGNSNNNRNPSPTSALEASMGLPSVLPFQLPPPSPYQQPSPQFNNNSHSSNSGSGIFNVGAPVTSSPHPHGSVGTPPPLPKAQQQPLPFVNNGW